MPTPTPADIIALKMPLLEALNLFSSSENAGPDDKRLAIETYVRLRNAISREIDEGTSIRHLFKAIIATAIVGVTAEVQRTWEGPVQIGP